MIIGKASKRGILSCGYTKIFYPIAECLIHTKPCTRRRMGKRCSFLGKSIDVELTDPVDHALPVQNIKISVGAHTEVNWFKGLLGFPF